MTPAAIKIISDRCGKGEPPLMTNGIENAPAKVTAPLTPDIVMIPIDFRAGFSTCKFFNPHLPHQDNIIQINRRE